MTKKAPELEAAASVAEEPKKYFGTKVVTDVVENLEYVADTKIKWFEISFEDGSNKVWLTERQVAYLITTEPADYTKTQDLVVENIVPEVMAILEQHNIKKGDMKPIFEAVFDSWNVAFLTAIGKAFGTYQAGTHHEYFQENIRVSDIAKIAGSK